MEAAILRICEIQVLCARTYVRRIIMPDRESVHIEHGRSEQQRDVMRKIAEDGVDPFDWNHLSTYHVQPVLRKGTYWLVTPNDNPYEGSTLHLLLIYRDRINSFADMPLTGWMELLETVQWIQREYGLTYGALVMRFGGLALSGASVDHPHMHVVVGGDSNEAEKLKVSIGYKQK
jgi:ATP adenylyltransferase